jgi:2-methylaconitate cis-trans-isomerase PrpF
METGMEEGQIKVHKAAILRTARKLFEGRVFPA